MRIIWFAILCLLLVLISPWCLKTVIYEIDKINFLDTSPDDSLILSASDSTSLIIWNATSFQRISQYSFSSKKVKCAKFSGDQKYIAVGFTFSSTIKILNGSTFTQVASFTSTHPSVNELNFNMDSTRLIACGTDSKYTVFNVTNTTTWATWHQNSVSGWIYTCKFAKTSNQYAIGHNTKVVKYIEDGTTSYTTSTAHNIFYRIDFFYNDTYILGANGDNKGYRITNGASMFQIRMADYQAMYTTACSNDGYNCVFGGADNKVYLFDNMSLVDPLHNKPLVTFNDSISSDITASAFTNDGNSILIGNANGTIFVYNKACTYCQSGYFSGRNGCQQCSTALEGCATCNNYIKCFECFPGYYLNTSFKCQPCQVSLPGCSYCKNSSICSSCVQSNYLNSSFMCDLCSKSMPGCMICFQQNICNQCDSEYYRDSNGSCIRCNNVANCLKCNSSTNCFQCLLGYYQTNGTCTSCPSNCRICLNQTNCIECSLGYRLAAGIVSGNCILCNITGCHACNRSNYFQCLECIPGRYLISGLCSTCKTQCSTCLNYTYCLSCNIGYYFSTVGVCSNCQYPCISCYNSTTCSSCDKGYYYVSSNQTCAQCSSNCSTCQSTTCFSCQPTYYLNSGSCTPCNTSISNCINCYNSSICSYCQVGYYIITNNSCGACSTGCSICSNSTVCSTCLPRYYLNNLTCNTCTNSCSTCSAANICLSCIDGFFLNSNSCTHCSTNITGCLSCLNSTFCISCQPSRYRSSSSSCDLCLSNCASCNSSSCFSCDLGFYLFNNSCLRCSQKCSECYTISNCSACIIGTYLETANNSCMVCPAGCTRCISTTQCYQCLDTYLLQPNGTCSQCFYLITKCLKCNTNTTCTKCTYGYSLSLANTTCSACTSIVGCQHCSNSSFCQICSINYYGDGVGGCIVCAQGCVSCTSSSNCLTCNPGYNLQGNICQLCRQTLLGCQYCSSNSTCINCYSNYFLANSTCSLCNSTLLGCNYCNSSSICTLCHNNYFLEVNNTCSVCGTGCQHCNSSTVCLQCQSGFYLTNNSCSPCNLQGCISCVVSSVCLICNTGYYLATNLTCSFCKDIIPGCILCKTSSNCLQCDSAYYRNSSGICVGCTAVGCQICNGSSPSNCITCNSQYYLNGTSCASCVSSLTGCTSCASPYICISCAAGYYIQPNNTCSLCSSSMTGCQQCNSSSICVECQSEYFLNGTSCASCFDLIPGCGYCVSSSICSSCLSGYFINGSLCSPCYNLLGCRVCLNSSFCAFCQEGYYSLNGICTACNTTITSCASCSSANVCLSCSGSYVLEGLTCVKIKVQVPKQYQSLKLISRYVSDSQLCHQLKVKGTKFIQIDQNWSAKVKLSLINQKDQQIKLNITAAQWGIDGYTILFYTNNPLNISNSTLGTMKFARRMLASNAFNLNDKVKIVMDQNTIHQILPSLYSIEDVVMDYSLNQPEFYQSMIKIPSTSYYIFGWAITAIMFIAYLIKSTVSAVESDDKGQIMADVLCLKIAVFSYYPLFVEYMDFCYGFMAADLPWFNKYFSLYLSDSTDYSPQPYVMFYANMNIASTYLLSLFLFSITLAIIMLLKWMHFTSLNTLKSVQKFFYNFFIMGLVFSSSSAIQGAYYNFSDKFTINSGLYALGICVYLLVMCHCMLCMYESCKQMYRGRIILKGTLLSLTYLSPLSFITFITILDIVLLAVQYYIVVKIKLYPRVWLASHIFATLTLALLILFPKYQIVFFFSLFLLLVALTLQAYVHYKQYRQEKSVSDVNLQPIINNSNINITADINLIVEDDKNDGRATTITFDTQIQWDSLQNQTKIHQPLRKKKKPDSYRSLKKESSNEQSKDQSNAETFMVSDILK